MGRNEAVSVPSWEDNAVPSHISYQLTLLYFFDNCNESNQRSERSWGNKTDIVPAFMYYEPVFSRGLICIIDGLLVFLF